MKEYQMSIFGGMVLVNNRPAKKKKSDVGMVSSGQVEVGTLLGVRSVAYRGSKTLVCDKCGGGGGGVVEHFVITTFHEEPPLSMRLCEAHKESYMSAFAPYSNTGQINPGADGE